MLGDLLGSIAVIAAAVIITTTGWLRADAVASVLVALMILPRTWTLLREAIDVLLEATPKGVRPRPGPPAHPRHTRRPGCPRPARLDDQSGMPVPSVHVVVDDEALATGGSGRILGDLCNCLREHFDVEHCTFQLEPAGHVDHEHAAHA